MTVKSIWLRRIHKWVGLVIGLQVLMWAISGTAMALLPMDEVAGGAEAAAMPPPLPAATPAWPVIGALAGEGVSALRTRIVLGRQLLEVTRDGETVLLDPATGRPQPIGASQAGAIAAAAHPGGASPTSARALASLPLAVREHALPIWQVDFADRERSSYFISGTTGEILERRNDSWRWWDFFWMLHNMDYASRTSFNHPLIIMAGLAMAWLATTGFWLLFRTMWRHDVPALKALISGKNGGRGKD